MKGSARQIGNLADLAVGFEGIPCKFLGCFQATVPLMKLSSDGRQIFVAVANPDAFAVADPDDFDRNPEKHPDPAFFDKLKLKSCFSGINFFLIKIIHILTKFYWQTFSLILVFSF